MRSVNSALKLYRRELLQQLPLAERGWLIDADARRRAQVIEAETRELKSAA